jgi:hypothetical protein
VAVSDDMVAVSEEMEAVFEDMIAKSKNLARYRHSISEGLLAKPENLVAAVKKSGG